MTEGSAVAFGKLLDEIIAVDGYSLPQVKPWLLSAAAGAQPVADVDAEAKEDSPIAIQLRKLDPFDFAVYTLNLVRELSTNVLTGDEAPPPSIAVAKQSFDLGSRKDFPTLGGVPKGLSSSGDQSQLTSSHMSVPQSEKKSKAKRRIRPVQLLTTDDAMEQPPGVKSSVEDKLKSVMINAQGRVGVTTIGFGTAAVSLPAQISTSTSAIEMTEGTSVAAKNAASLGEEDLAPLAELYAFLIIEGIAPNVATELHLLFRLLMAHSELVHESGPDVLRAGQAKDDTKLATTHTGKLNLLLMQHTNRIIAVPWSAADCRQFAVRALEGLVPLLCHLGRDVLVQLAGSKPIMQTLEGRKLSDALSSIISSMQNTQDRVEETAIVSNLGAPDSPLQRHDDNNMKHLKKQQEKKDYMNRMKCLDSFANCAREFHSQRNSLSVPGNTYKDLGRKAHAMLAALEPANLRWFAEHFIQELLGQGLAPAQEMDTEVLALAEPRRMASLQQRLSGSLPRQRGNPSRSSQKLGQKLGQAHGKSSNRKDRGRGVSGSGTSGASLTSLGPIHMAPLTQGWFPGNQEFFYLFLVTLDSYRFAAHLTEALAASIRLLLPTSEVRPPQPAGGSSHTPVEGFTDRLVKLKVLAKFMGVLVFSPRWSLTPRDEQSTSQKSQEQFIAQVSQINASRPVLDVLRLIREAWDAGSLAVVVPWAADYLRMIKLDEASQQSSYYTSVLQLLVCVHASQIMHPTNPDFGSGLLFVKCELESLFESLELVGSRRTQLLKNGPQLPTPRRAAGERVPFDAQLRLTRVLLEKCSHALDDLYSVLRLGAESAPPTPRKRLVVKRVPPTIRAENGTKLPLPPTAAAAATATGSSEAPIDLRESIQKGLVTAFFQQHPELHRVANFVVSTVVSNACNAALADAPAAAVAAALSDLKKELGTEQVLLSMPIDELKGLLTNRGLVSARPAVVKTAHSLCTTGVSAIAILAPPLLPDQVKQVAVHVATKHAKQVSGERVVSSLRVSVTQCAQEVVDAIGKRRARQQCAAAGEQDKEHDTKEGDKTKGGEEQSNARAASTVMQASFKVAVGCIKCGSEGDRDKATERMVKLGRELKDFKTPVRDSLSDSDDRVSHSEALNMLRLTTEDGKGGSQVLAFLATAGAVNPIALEAWVMGWLDHLAGPCLKQASETGFCKCPLEQRGECNPNIGEVVSQAKAKGGEAATATATATARAACMSLVLTYHCSQGREVSSLEDVLSTATPADDDGRPAVALGKAAGCTTDNNARAAGGSYDPLQLTQLAARLLEEF